MRSLQGAGRVFYDELLVYSCGTIKKSSNDCGKLKKMDVLWRLVRDGDTLRINSEDFT